MAQQEPAPKNPPSGDPWHAFGYLVAGVAFYGLLGWLADQWLGTSFLVAVGILLGAGLGVYMTWARFRIRPDSADASGSKKNVTTQELQ
jgi:F0F1-type ATP synthase assembly protein I